jgi:hypothetical protein
MAQHPGIANSPLRPVVELWLSKIKIALEHKKEVFQDDADEIMRFYSEPHDFMYGSEYSKKSKSFVVGDDETDVPAPTFRMTANKVAEFVQLFGPMLYHKNPIRKVTPRNVPKPPPELFGVPPDGMATPAGPDQQQNQMMAMMTMQYQMVRGRMDQQRVQDSYRAELLQTYLNYTPNELDLKSEMSMAIDEAMVKGRGVMWTEVFQRPLNNGQKLVGNFFGSVDDLIIDPDAEDLKDAHYVVRRCIKAAWEVEEKFGWEPGSLNPNRESLNQQALTAADPNGMDRRKRGKSCDQVIYYEIWSRMGAGSRLREGEDRDGPLDYMVDRLKPFLDSFGPFVYLAVAEGVNCPLNVPPELLDAPGGMEDPQVAETLRANFAWPIPFFADAQNPWPFTEIDFHPIPKRAWPMAHMRPAMGYQKFLNWIYSLMANKIKITCRDIIMMAMGQDPEVKAAIEHGADLTIIELQTRNPGEFEQIMKVLQMEPMNKDVWQVADKIEMLFEKATGQTDILYGMQSGPALRSAQEAALKGDMTRLRPDAMVNVVENSSAVMARKEAMAARWVLRPQNDIAPVLGQDGAIIWSMLLFSQDVFYVVRELEYRIEAGSSKKPNRDLDLANSNDAAQFVFPMLKEVYAANGNPEAVNAFLRFWCKARDLDPDPFMLPVMPPPPPPGAGPPPGGPPPAKG